MRPMLILILGPIFSAEEVFKSLIILGWEGLGVIPIDNNWWLLYWDIVELDPPRLIEMSIYLLLITLGTC